MAVGHLLLQSFSANVAIFHLMMLAYNLFLLFKMDFTGETEYRQQIKKAMMLNLRQDSQNHQSLR
jgi:hypothetical protein